MSLIELGEVEIGQSVWVAMSDMSAQEFKRISPATFKNLSNKTRTKLNLIQLYDSEISCLVDTYDRKLKEARKNITYLEDKLKNYTDEINKQISEEHNDLKKVRTHFKPLMDKHPEEFI